ncbi:hypothetical protein BpHYR1_012242 [Brachionus plicatilis]|uniref:Uncharacterized protein n=1 Tax=Brachionus plicatilis TaxID=10195 RepID=A0A3M7S963_BRAPC|nr:hypothetical protein BpHYR1_012242 [Brachionus plicatilis]
MIEYRDEEVQTDYLSDAPDLTDFIVPQLSQKPELDHDIFLAMIPRWKFDVGRHYEKLTNYLYKWNEFFELCRFKLFTFFDFIHNELFYQIIKIHNELVNEGYKSGILPILIELSHRKTHFLIPYVYITNQLPKEFKQINYLFFGFTDKYPEMISKTKEEIKQTKPPIKPIKEIFSEYDIQIDPTYDLF